MMRKSKTIHSGTETKTERQWLQVGRLLKKDAIGERLWTNGFCQLSAVYYGIGETYEPTKEELKAAKEPYLAPKREAARKRRALERAKKMRDESILQALDSPAVPCCNPSKTVAFDAETTGLYPGDDEIIQFFACDGDGNTLLDTYIRPYVKDSWPESQQIHGISPEMVKDAPYAHEIIPILKGIFETAELLVTYNGVFDEQFLEEIGIDLHLVSEFDVMREFAPIYGDWNEYRRNYNWQKLTTCAAYYGYEFIAHNAKEDTLATLFCYREIIKQRKS